MLYICLQGKRKRLSSTFSGTWSTAAPGGLLVSWSRLGRSRCALGPVLSLASASSCCPLGLWEVGWAVWLWKVGKQEGFVFAPCF